MIFFLSRHFLQWPACLSLLACLEPYQHRVQISAAPWLLNWECVILFFSKKVWALPSWRDNIYSQFYTSLVSEWHTLFTNSIIDTSYTVMHLKPVKKNTENMFLRVALFGKINQSVALLCALLATQSCHTLSLFCFHPVRKRAPWQNSWCS